MNRESFLYVVVFTFLVAFVFVFIIAIADNATAARVAQNRELVKAQAFLSAAGLTENDNDKTLRTFNSLFGAVDGDSIIKASIEGKEILIKQFSGQGLWGTVTGVLASDASVERIIGLDIMSHVETPGLGGRIEEDWFKDQFRHEKIQPDGISIRKGEGGSDSNPDNSVVDGVTGASLTSAAMEVIINNEIAKLREAR